MLSELMLVSVMMSVQVGPSRPGETVIERAEEQRASIEFVPSSPVKASVMSGGMIDVPSNTRVRGDGEPAVTIVGADRVTRNEQPVIERGLFGSPIIARSDLVFRSFDKRLSITEIHLPRHRFRPNIPQPAPEDPRLVEMRENLRPLDSRYPPVPGR